MPRPHARLCQAALAADRLHIIWTSRCGSDLIKASWCLGSSLFFFPSDIVVDNRRCGCVGRHTAIRTVALLRTHRTAPHTSPTSTPTSTPQPHFTTTHDHHDARSLPHSPPRRPPALRATRRRLSQHENPPSPLPRSSTSIHPLPQHQPLRRARAVPIPIPADLPNLQRAHQAELGCARGILCAEHADLRAGAVGADDGRGAARHGHDGARARVHGGIGADPGVCGGVFPVGSGDYGAEC